MDHHAAIGILTPAAGRMRFGFYRLQQFWKALFQHPSQVQHQRVLSILSKKEFDLFCQMQPSEQLHSIQVMERLTGQGIQNPDLLAAALLHDVGKSKVRLTIWGRAVIVIAHAFIPNQARRWGEDPLKKSAWRRAFIVSQHHAAWGADMAMQAGSTSQTVNLIRAHQEKKFLHLENEAEKLLALLQAADNET